MLIAYWPIDSPKDYRRMLASGAAKTIEKLAASIRDYAGRHERQLGDLGVLAGAHLVRTGLTSKPSVSFPARSAGNGSAIVVTVPRETC